MNVEQPSLPVAKFEPPAQATGDPMLALVERAARDPGIDVEKMEKLLAMAERVQARKAEAEYDSAMNAAQAEMRPVANDSDNPQTRSRYASYGALDRAVRPIYTAHGFSLSFGTRSPTADRVTVTCRISHRAGHTERVEIDMPADGKGAKGGDVMTKTHATGSAVSYGMRYLLKMIFNIAAGEYDDDGNAAGKRPPAPTPPAPKATPAASPAAKPKGDDAGWRAMLAKCKAKLVEEARGEFYWAWWRYAIDQSWIIPSHESLADARPEVMFAGADQVRWKESLGAIALKHRMAVKALAETCPPDLRQELIGAAVPLPASKPADKQESGTAQPPAPGKNGCPHCSSTATKQSEDYEAVRWCQKCGWQWDSAGQPFEAHPWQFAVCPVPPKGTKKAEYDKAKQTLGQIQRTNSDRAFGLVMNCHTDEDREWNGKVYHPSNEDMMWAEACKLARDHMEAQKNKEGEPDEPDWDIVP